MSHDYSAKNVPEDISEVELGDFQRSIEVLGEETKAGIRSEASIFEAGQPDPEPSGENAVLSMDSACLRLRELEEELAAAPNGATLEIKGPSARKLMANRENAKHSTGPKTPRGKAVSARNSYKHGIFSAGLIRKGEMEEGDRTRFVAIVDAIAECYQPVGFMEQLLVEKIATETIRFHRLLSHEKQELGRKDPFWGAGVDRVLRYQATINRQLFQAMEQLDRLQAKRKEQSSSGDGGELKSNGRGVSNGSNASGEVRSNYQDAEKP